MATTRIIPLHTGKGRTAGTAISRIIDYVKNPDKTEGNLFPVISVTAGLLMRNFFWQNDSTYKRPEESGERMM